MRRLNATVLSPWFKRGSCVTLSLVLTTGMLGCFGSDSSQPQVQPTVPQPEARAEVQPQPRELTPPPRVDTTDPELRRVQDQINSVYGNPTNNNDPAYQPESYTRTEWANQPGGNSSRQPKPNVVPRPQPARNQNPPQNTSADQQPHGDADGKVVWGNGHQEPERNAQPNPQPQPQNPPQRPTNTEHRSTTENGIQIINPSYKEAPASASASKENTEYLKMLQLRVLDSVRSGQAYRFTRQELAPLSQKDQKWLIMYSEEMAKLIPDQTQKPNHTTVDHTLTKEEQEAIIREELKKEELRKIARDRIAKEQAEKEQERKAAKEQRLNGDLPRRNFRVDNMKLCLEVQGFGKYEEVKPDYFVAGKENPVLIYNEISNYKSVYDKKELKYFTFLRQEVMLLNAETGAVIWNEKPTAIVDSSAVKRQDFFIIRMITLTKDLPAGEYILKVRMIDERLEETDAITHSITIHDARVVDGSR